MQAATAAAVAAAGCHTADGQLMLARVGSGRYPAEDVGYFTD